jgi:cytochrome c peroxidase
MQWQLTGFFWDGRAELLRHQALLPIQDPLEMDETIGNMLAKLNSSQVYRGQFKKAFNIDEIDEEHVALAIEQFISIIVSASSKFDIGKVLGFTNFNDEELRGMNIFQQEAKPNDPNNTGADCGHCHGTNLFMIQEFMNNGLDSLSEDPGRMNVTGNTNDRGKFKVPSLRNIEKTAPYMHDGRFNTLEEVIEFYMFGVHVNPNIDPGRMHALKDSVFLSSQQRADLIAFLKTLTDTTFLNSTEYSNPFH